MPSVICAVPHGQNTEKPFAIPALDAAGGTTVQDVLIAEDDPFFLHIGEYVPMSQRKAAEGESPGEEASHFIDGLAPNGFL
ncbi:hypothetical protein EDB86DRAFT_3081370 [Lactarius hatsudake]|nr:hypothetical protein EDB86DRAFT_3081370 [Lactarius hatsudake]